MSLQGSSGAVVAYMLSVNIFEAWYSLFRPQLVSVPEIVFDKEGRGNIQLYLVTVGQ